MQVLSIVVWKLPIPSPRCPACAVAAGAASVYRNYFAPTVGDQVGQTKDTQLNTLEKFDEIIGNRNHRVTLFPIRCYVALGGG